MRVGTPRGEQCWQIMPVIRVVGSEDVEAIARPKSGRRFPIQISACEVRDLNREVQLISRAITRLIGPSETPSPDVKLNEISGAKPGVTLAAA